VPDEFLILVGSKVLIELLAEPRNHRQEVWLALVANVHALNEPVFQRVDMLDHTVEKHVA
jgi:hypothetical protein